MKQDNSILFLKIGIASIALLILGVSIYLFLYLFEFDVKVYSGASIIPVEDFNKSQYDLLMKKNKNTTSKNNEQL